MVDIDDLGTFLLTDNYMHAMKGFNLIYDWAWYNGWYNSSYPTLTWIAL
jgi:hypothetical protein